MLVSKWPKKIGDTGAFVITLLYDTMTLFLTSLLTSIDTIEFFTLYH